MKAESKAFDQNLNFNVYILKQPIRAHYFEHVIKISQ